MTSLSYLLARSKRNPAAVDPIQLDGAGQSRFDSWDAGFKAFEAGTPIEQCRSVAGRARPGWRQGWEAAKRMSELKAEQTAGKGDW